MTNKKVNITRPRQKYRLLSSKECGFTLRDHAKIYVDYESYKKGIFGNDYFSIEGDREIHVFSAMEGWCE